MEFREPINSKQQRDLNWLRNNKPELITESYDIHVSVQNKKYLLIYEGANTEFHYFSSFKIPSVTVQGGCNSKNSLINYAIEQSQKPEFNGYEIWCIYDMDVKPDEAATQPQDFNNSIQRAEANGFKVAWSNDSFELWFLLHYHLLEACITRVEINQKLKGEWGIASFHKTAKSKDFSMGHYARLGGATSDLQKNAIRNARNLHAGYVGRNDYANHCPCTTVYQLVAELNAHLKL